MSVYVYENMLLTLMMNNHMHNHILLTPSEYRKILACCHLCEGSKSVISVFMSNFGFATAIVILHAVRDMLAMRFQCTDQSTMSRMINFMDTSHQESGSCKFFDIVLLMLLKKLHLSSHMFRAFHA